MHISQGGSAEMIRTIFKSHLILNYIKDYANGVAFLHLELQNKFLNSYCVKPLFT